MDINGFKHTCAIQFTQIRLSPHFKQFISNSFIKNFVKASVDCLIETIGKNQLIVVNFLYYCKLGLINFDRFADEL